jgi:hypothetical protein
MHTNGRETQEGDDTFLGNLTGNHTVRDYLGEQDIVGKHTQDIKYTVELAQDISK